MTTRHEQQDLRSMGTILEFWDTVRRECERADRYEMRLSMVVYEIGVKDEKSPLVRQLVKKLYLRVRNMDYVGWFDIGQIGILVPHTQNDGAMKLARDVYHLMAPLTSPPPFTIFTYPSERWPIKKSFALRLRKLLLYVKTLINPQGITKREELRVHLELEQDRASRYGHTFSLLVFHTAAVTAHGRHLTKVAKAINSRLRESDTFGWYGSGDIAAILPYATFANAVQIGQTICRMIDIPVEGSFTVYAYPDQWLSENAPSPCEREFQGSMAGPPPDGEFRSAVGRVQGDRRVSTLNLSEVDDFFAKPLPVWKRTMDIIGSLLGIILFSPLFFVAMAGIQATSPGPILFRQTRIGYKRRPFTLLKFRSMHPDCDAETHRKFMKHLIASETNRPNTKLASDERIFSFGRFLRKTSIDELPQLFNVLRGEMSLVGPRPCLSYEADEYLQWHSRRFYTMPGLTGLWQVSGKNRLSFQQMIRLDIQYVKKRSFWMDVKIIIKTFPAVVSIFFEKDS